MGKNYKALLFTGKGISAPYILEDCKQGLIKNSCEVMELPASSRDADIKTFLTNMKPDFVLSLDHAGINDELFDELEIPCFSWFVDNPFYFINETHKSPSSFFLVTDRSYIRELQHYGFKNIFYLPLATNIERMNTMQTKKFLPMDISFVGTLGKRYTEWRSERNYEAKSPTREILDLLVHLKIKNPSMSFEDMFNFCDGKFQQEILQKLKMKDRGSIEFRIDIETSAYFRETYLLSLAHHKVSVFGDDGWKKFLPEHYYFGGKIDYNEDVGNVYRLSQINLNITRTQIQSGINQRILDIAATGAIFLTDYRSSTQEFFDCDLRYLMFKDENDLREKVDYFLKSDKIRTMVGNELFQSVYNKHTYEHRMREFLQIFEKVRS